MNKRIAKNTIYLYLRMMLSMGVTLYTSRIVLATLGVEDYGIYSGVSSVVLMFTFLNISISSATLRFLNYALGKGDKEELRKTFSAAITIHILIVLVIFICAESIGLWFLENKMVIAPERMNAARVVYQLSVFSLMATVMQVPYNSTIIAHERMHIFAFIEILNVCLKLGVVFLLVIANWDKLIMYAALWLIVACLITGVYMRYCIKQFKECKYKYEWNKTVIYPMLKFSGWDALGNGAVVGATKGVNILLNLFYGAFVNAAWGISDRVNEAIYAFVRSFQMAVNPQIVKLYASEKMTELYSLIFQNAKFSFSLMWLLLLPVSIHLETILNIWLVEVPEYTALFCRLVLIQSLISCVQRPFVMTIHATGKMKIFQLSAGTVLLSGLPVSYFLLRSGCAPHIPFVVYIGACTGELLVELILLKKWINLSFRALFKTVFIPVALIVAFTLPLSLLASLYLPFLLSLMFSGMAVCISVYFIALDKETKAKLVQYVKNYFHSNNNLL